jgi:ABC-type transporter Mla MlaB component
VGRKGAKPTEPATTALVVSGPVTVTEVPRWRDALLAVMAASQDIRLNLAAAGPWDLAGLQLLISALASGRRVRLVEVPRVCLASAERAGLGERLAEAIESRLD